MSDYRQIELSEWSLVGGGYNGQAYVSDTHLGSLKAPVLLSPAGQSEQTGAYKILENDRVVIIRNEEKYSIMGTEIE